VNQIAANMGIPLMGPDPNISKHPRDITANDLAQIDNTEDIPAPVNVYTLMMHEDWHWAGCQ